MTLAIDIASGPLTRFVRQETYRIHCARSVVIHSNHRHTGVALATGLHDPNDEPGATLNAQDVAADARRARPVRVLHIASGDLWAGAEVQVFTLLCHLARDTAFSVHAVLLNDGTLAERLRGAGVPVTVLDERRISSMRILLEIRRLMNRLRPDIVHTHRQKENVLGALANASTVRARMVRTQHGAAEHRPRWSQPAKRLNAWLDRFSARLTAATVVAVAPHLQPKLARQFGAYRVVVIENGVDAEAIIRSQREAPFRAREPGSVHVGIVGRLVPVKRVDLFLETAAIVRARAHDDDWRFHVFGDGPLRSALEARCSALGLESVMAFHGHDPEAIRYLNGLDALMLCSDHEGLPMTVLEARAVGVPIVAHAVGGIPVALKNYERAVLVPNQEPAEYASALCRLAARYARLRPLSPLPRTGDRFDADTNATRMAALYTAILDRVS